MCNNQNTNVCHHQLFLTLLYQSVYTDVCTGLPSLVVFISLDDNNKMEFENINHDIFIQCHACETSRCCACLVVQCLFHHCFKWSTLLIYISHQLAGLQLNGMFLNQNNCKNKRSVCCSSLSSAISSSYFRFLFIVCPT